MLWIWEGLAEAHAPGLSYGRIEADRLVLTFSETEMGALVPIGEPGSEVLIVRETIGKASLEVGGAPCTVGEGTVRRVENDGMEVSAPISCPVVDGPDGEVWTLHASYLSAMTPGHRHFVEAFGQPVATLDASQPDATFTGQAETGSVALRFGELGVEHILTGYDHLAFVAALLLGARSARQVLGLVTTFTVAHSITLGMATLGWITLPSSVVEPLIAASILFVGVENLIDPPYRRRLVLTFLFGLIHGMGFAGLLAELGIPRAELVLALVAFNVGVEIGQLSVVLAAVLLLGWMTRLSTWPTRWRPGLSLIVAAGGLYWLVERLTGLMGG